MEEKSRGRSQLVLRIKVENTKFPGGLEGPIFIHGTVLDQADCTVDLQGYAVFASDQYEYVPKYYRLLDDINFPGRWHLSNIQGIDNWILTRPPMLSMDDPLRDKVLDVEVRRVGTALDFTLAGYAAVPIVSFEALQAIMGIDGFTAITAKIEAFRQRTSYYALHLWETADCVDEGHSEFEVIPENDPVRPDLAGNYRSVTKLVIDPNRTLQKHMFRLSRLSGHIIVSDKIKKRFDDAGLKGALFVPVSP